MSNTNTSTEPEYELKHRLTGAAILIVLAVVVIPLFLSEPALEANTAVDKDGVAVQTFRSRIVPLNINNVNGANVADQDNGDSGISVVEVDSRKPALLDLTLSGGKSDDAIAEKKSEQKKTALVMTNQKAADTGTKAAIKPLSKSETKIVQPAQTEEKPAAKLAAVSKTQNSVATQSSAPKNNIEEGTSGDSGWVVRVGTFSKQANVDSVSTLLNNSGFNPKTKTVDTSLGESTRVWLGPYAKRETADKISARLKSLIGEKGYVTRTNS